LVPTFKSIGAAIANVISEAIVTVCYIYFIRKFFIPKSNFKYVWQSLATTIIFIPIHLFFRTCNFPIWLLVPFSATTCLISFIAIQYWIFKNYFILDILIPVKKKIPINNKQTGKDQ
jgi:drug/metabolite transporter (DMT)-like permease